MNLGSTAEGGRFVTIGEELVVIIPNDAVQLQRRKRCSVTCQMMVGQSLACMLTCGGISLEAVEGGSPVGALLKGP